MTPHDRRHLLEHYSPATWFREADEQKRKAALEMLSSEALRYGRIAIAALGMGAGFLLGGFLTAFLSDSDRAIFVGFGALGAIVMLAIMAVATCKRRVRTRILDHLADSGVLTAEQELVAREHRLLSKVYRT